MKYRVRDPSNPRIMHETNVDPSRGASPLDLQTEADRAREAARQEAEREYAYEHGPLPAGGLPRAIEQEAPRIGSMMDVPRMAGGKVNILDIPRFVEGWHDLPLWQRDEILQQVQARNETIEAAQRKKAAQEEAERLSQMSLPRKPPAAAAAPAPEPRAIEQGGYPGLGGAYPGLGGAPMQQGVPGMDEVMRMLNLPQE